MSTIQGLGFSDVRPQPGFTATQGDTGGWTGRHTFIIRRTAWANASIRSQFAKGVSITELDTGLSSFWGFMKVVTTEVTSEEGDLTTVTVSIAGGGASQFGDEGEDTLSDAAEPVYQLRGQLQDAPFSMHPRWQALTEEQQTALGHLINGVLVFDETSGKISKINSGATDSADFFDPFLPYDAIVTDDCLEFAKLISKGESTYLRPVFTWTESTQGSSSLTSSQLNLLGNIATPRGNPPTPSGTRDWMLTSAFQEERGELFVTDLEWTLSEKGGNSSLLYTEPTP
jgi:hypothetical protein